MKIQKRILFTLWNLQEEFEEKATPRHELGKVSTSQETLNLYFILGV